MKRIKLITSAIALVICFSIFTFGVYAITSPKILVTGSVSFEVKDVAVLVQAKIQNAANFETKEQVHSDDYPTSEIISASQYYDSTTGESFADANDQLANWDISTLTFSRSTSYSPITISFNITNNSPYPITARVNFNSDSFVGITRNVNTNPLIIQNNESEELIISYSLDSVRNNVELSDIGMQLTFEKTVTTLDNWSGRYDSELGGVVLTNYAGDATSIVIPSEIDTTTLVSYDATELTGQSSNANGLVLNQLENANILPVVGLEGDGGDSMFLENYENITSVYIPSSVKSIGDWAFYWCSSLVSVKIPNSVEFIGTESFSGCTSLSSLTIPDNILTIGGTAFYNCSSLTSLTIGNGVQTIGGAAFYNCSSLTSLTLGNGVQTIGDFAFRDCSSLTKVYYNGTEAEKIATLTSIGSGNTPLTNATWYYYDETESKVGNYWHYGDNGEIVVHPAS